MIIHLNNQEARICQWLAKVRAKRLKAEPDADAIGAELAVCRALNICPDLTADPTGRTYDCRIGRLRLKVVHATHIASSLLVSPDVKLDECEAYVLVSGTMPVLTIKGWIWEHELVDRTRLLDTTDGRFYGARAGELRCIKELSK